MSRTNGGYPLRIIMPTDKTPEELELLKQELLAKHGPFLPVFLVEREWGTEEISTEGVGDA